MSLAIGLCLSLVAGCTPAGPRALLEGKRLIDQGKYPEAVEHLRTAANILTNNAQAWNYLGLAYHYQGQAALAEQAYQHALALNKDLSEAHYNLGCLWLTENKFEAAKAELTSYTLRQGNSLGALLRLGNAQLHCREGAAAEKSFTEALRLSPQNAEALNGLGLARLQRNRPNDAAECFKNALKLDPDYRAAALNLAIVAQQYLRDRPLALQNYRLYLAIQPPAQDSEYVASLARILEQELTPPPRQAPTTPPQQTNVVVSLPKPAPTNPPLLANLAKPSPNTNLPRPLPPTNVVKPPVVAAPKEPMPAPPTTKVEVVTLPAEPVIRPAQDITPPAHPSESPPRPVAATNVPPANLSRTNLASETQVAETKHAKRGFLQRINPLNLFRSEEKKPQNQTALQQSPPPQPSAGSSPPQPEPGTPASTNVASAEPAAKPAPPPKPLPRYTYLSPAKPASGNREAAHAEFARGLEAQKANNLSEAIQAYRSALRTDPGYFEAYYDLGLAETQAGQLAAALAAYEYALSLQPGHLDCRYNFALLLKQANYPVDAAQEMEKVVASQPNDVRAHLMLGLVYAQQLHNTAKAREHYLKVLDLDPQNAQAAAIRYWLTTNP